MVDQATENNTEYIPNVDLEYYCSRKHLCDWGDIDQELRGVLDKLHQKIQMQKILRHFFLIILGSWLDFMKAQ